MIGSIGASSLNNISAMQNTGYSVEAKETPKDVAFSYNPQDKLVMSPTTTTISGVIVNKRGPQTKRVALRGEGMPANNEGDFVFKPENKHFAKAMSFATVAKTLETFENAYGAKVPWAFGQDQIELYPDAGQDLNAYYSRDDKSVNFFHDKVNGEMVYSGTSGEVVSHEVGHAMLDGLKPDYLMSWKADTNGFHEAFADLTALFVSTQDDGVCELVASQTGGDLSKPNCLAETGELLGSAINEKYGQNVTGGNYIRNAINDFKWQAPNTVPKNPGGTDPLTTEMHSWSRIWTGAQYDMLGGMVSRNMEEGMSAADAVKSAGKECMELYGKMLRLAPKADVTYRQMALSMLKADESMGGKNHDLIIASFTNRNILFEGDDTPKGDMLAMESEPRTVTTTLMGSDFGMFSGAEVSTKVDGNPLFMASDSKTAQDLQQDMKRLIQDGAILYTEPNQTVKKEDLFDKNGNPYMGVVRWTDGKMVIERNAMIS